MYRGEE
jgi:hypothetical protein